MKTKFAVVLSSILSLTVSLKSDGAFTARNPPSACQAPDGECPCATGDGAQNKCIKVTVDMGVTTPWSGMAPCALKVFADDQSPMVFTPVSLYAVCGYTFKRIGNAVLSDGVTPAEVVLAHPNGESVRFVFTDGESLSRPDPGFHIPMDERLMMVDAQGWACTRDPVYYDLYETDGTVRRFLATDQTNARGRLVSVTDSRGVVTTAGDMGIDVVYGPDGVRQFLTPSRLADVRVFRGGYTVTVYPVEEPPAKDPATGLYPLPDSAPVERVSIESEANGRKAIVTLRSGEGDPKRYVYEYVCNDWSMTRPSGVEERQDRTIEDSRRARTVKEIYSPSKELLSRDEYNYVWQDWGFAATNHIEGFGGTTRTTSWEYYTSGNGKGQVKSELHQSGLRIEHAYDAANRVISTKRSGPDMMTEVTTYSYISVDPADIVPPVDTRPRTIVRKLDGIECERAYYVYSPLTNIVERVGTQGASYGSTNVLRTVTAFYSAQVGAAGSAARAGRIKSIRHEDGRLDLYDYALTEGLWTETVTHLHEQSPEPVSGKTTRDTTLTNCRGETVEQKTEAFIDGSWYTIARDRMTYNTRGKRIQTENLAGKATVADWDCCHKVSETQPDGSTTTWEYDQEDRMVASSRLIPTDLTNVTWVTTCYAYDDLGRQTATWTTNTTAHIGIPATSTSYDALGRVTSRSVPGRGTSLTSYSSSGLIVTNTAPNGALTITRRNADGDTISVTGDGVTPEFYSRGVLADGTRWTKTVQGETADSPRFTKGYENLLGETVRSEKSGFRGAALASVNTYDAYGRLVSTASDGEPTTAYAYDDLGDRVATMRMVGGGLRPPRPVANPTEWRKSESSSNFALIGSDVWLIQTNAVSCSDTAIAPLVQSSSRQLTGLTPQNPACTRTTDIRGNITESWTEFTDGFLVAKRRVPEATNIIRSYSRYGVELETVSLSAVTNAVCYDALGRPVAAIDGRGNVTRTNYDAFGRRSASIDALGYRTAYAYDRFGNLVAVTNALGHATVYEYDLRGRKTYEGGATYPVRYAYDIFGNKVSMTTCRDELKGAGDTTTWLYDEASGVVINKIYADGRGPSYDYDANGRLIKRTWARGVETRYSYDSWGNLTNTTYSDDTPGISLVYDAMGRQIRTTDVAGTTTFAYDAFGSLTNETVVGVAGTNTIERFSDSFGRDAGYALNGVRQSTLGYDPATGRLATMLVAGSETPFAWNYLAGSDLKSSLSYPNGLTASWTYGNRGELLQVCNARTVSSSPSMTSNNLEVVSRYAYTYDAVGRRVACVKSGSAFTTPDTYAYLYNTRSELTNATAAVDALYRYGYDFDDIGNRKTSSERGTNSVYTASQLNQYTAVDDFTPTYDADGNQTLVKTATGIWQVTYNGENRPVLWTQGTNTISMSFDRMGRRVTKNDQRFVYKGYWQIANNSGDQYLWDPIAVSLSMPLRWKSQCGNMFYIHDGNKNVSEVVSETAQVTAHYEYAPFGALTACRGSLADLNSWRFSSEYSEDDTSTVYYNYRHYDSLMGRWFVQDPINEVDNANLYGYVANSLSIDYLGLINFAPIPGLSGPCGDGVELKCKQEMQELVNRLNTQLQKLNVPLRRGDNVFGDLWSKILSIYYKYNLPTQDPRGPSFGDEWKTKKEKDKEIEDILPIYNSIWESRRALTTNLKNIANEMKKENSGGTQVVCCPRKGNHCKSDMRGFVTDGGYFTLEKKHGFARPEDAALDGKIIICPAVLADGFKSVGGCGCFMMHELMHKYGMSVSNITDDSVKRNVENAMIEIARLILGKECKGYDVE